MRTRAQQSTPRRTPVDAEPLDILDGLDETPELGRAIANLASQRLSAAAFEEAVALADRAHAIGERFQDARTIANALITKGSSIRNPGQREEGSALIQRGLALAKDAGLADVALRAYSQLEIREELEPVARERLLEEGIAYAERHGIEQPMLIARRANAAFLRGDWDVALAAAERVPEGSFWHYLADGVRISILLGRQGPAAALSLARRRAEAALGHTEAQRVGPPLVLMMFVTAVADDRDDCRRWSVELLARVRADPGFQRLIAIAAGWSTFSHMLSCASSR